MFFIIKKNGSCYVGSSISLNNRLTTGYFIPGLGNRKIDLAIISAGLESFYIDIYVLPTNLIKDKDKIFKRNLSLVLEQVLILELNPELNTLKVAGSPAGLKRSIESMLPSLIKNSKPIYLYDENSKEYIYVANSQSIMARELKMNLGNLTKYKNDNILYLNRFIFSDTLLKNYTENIMESKDIINLMKENRIVRRQELMKQVDITRENTYKKSSIKMELINIKTKEVLLFDSISEVARYLKEYDITYKCSAGTVSDYSKRGIIYKGLFKINRI